MFKTSDEIKTLSLSETYENKCVDVGLHLGFIIQKSLGDPDNASIYNEYIDYINDQIQKHISKKLFFNSKNPMKSKVDADDLYIDDDSFDQWLITNSKTLTQKTIGSGTTTELQNLRDSLIIK